MKHRFLAHTVVNIALIIVVALCARVVGAVAPLGGEEAAFLRDLYATGRSELALANAVQGRVESPVVREYLERLIRDHAELETAIKAVAQAGEITLSSEPSPQTEAALNELNERHGAELERAYMRRALAQHRGMMARLEEQTRNARNEGVRELARTALGRAREHLALAQRWDPRLSPAPPPLVRTIPGADR